MSGQESDESRGLTRLSDLLREATAAPTPAELDRGLGKLQARLSVRGGTRGQHIWLRRSALTALCLSLTALAMFWLRPRTALPSPPAALRRVEGGQLLQGGYLSETGAAGIRLVFDEGSQVALSPGGRGRLRFDKSVHLMLERGAAALEITPTPEPRWVVESGPFLVTVKGTDFTVSWDPTREQFELALRRGRVVVSGPLVGDGFVMGPGQKLRVSLPRAETVITEEHLAGPATSAPSAAPSVAEVADSPAPETEANERLPGNAFGPTPSPTGSAPPYQRQWRSALATGQWDRIITEAEQSGLETTLSAASSDDLFALADAARYRRRLDLAQAALGAVRRRFPSSPRASEAIFLLGRVSEQRPSGRAAALQYYSEYLARAESGTYAAEALGRKMTLLSESGGPARAIAEEYLRRFPSGSYAGAARTLVSAGE